MRAEEAGRRLGQPRQTAGGRPNAPETQSSVRSSLPLDPTCWFKPHAYGYGATPTGWKGWAAVAAYVAALLALSLPLAVWPADLPAGPTAWQVATWFILTALLTLAFLRLARAKTDGQWRWRWGK